MTQLISVLCNDSKCVVTASDRMVSTADMSLTFEPERTKAKPINEKTLILTAGTVHEPDLISEIKDKSIGKKKVVEIANIAKDLFQKLRKEHIEDEVLKSIGIDTFKDYFQCQRVLHEGITLKTAKKIEDYDLDVVLLLLGIDENKDGHGHIIRISNPGVWRSFDKLGFCCLGMGDSHTMSVFAWYKYTSSITLKDATYIAFEAKKRSEVAGGVGKETDMYIISKKGIKKVPDIIIEKLEAIYNEREEEKRNRGIDERISKLGIKAS